MSTNTTFTQLLSDLKGKMINMVSEGSYQAISISKPDGTQTVYESKAEFMRFYKEIEALAKAESASSTFSSLYKPIYLRRDRI